MDAAILGDRLLERTQKPLLGPGKSPFAVPALRELESACRVSILWDAVTVPRSAFQGFCGGNQRGHWPSAAVCDPNGPRPFARYRYVGIAGCEPRNTQAKSPRSGRLRNRIPPQSYFWEHEIFVPVPAGGHFFNFFSPPGLYEFLEKLAKSFVPVILSFMSHINFWSGLVLVCEVLFLIFCLWKNRWQNRALRWAKRTF